MQKMNGACKKKSLVGCKTHSYEIDRLELETATHLYVYKPTQQATFSL
jgi:hypothetical protein